MTNAQETPDTAATRVLSQRSWRGSLMMRDLTSYSDETPTTPCQHDMGRWDLDRGTYPDWVRARAECRSCQLLVQSVPSWPSSTRAPGNATRAPKA